MPKGVAHRVPGFACLFHSDDEVVGVNFLFRVPFTSALHWDREQEQRGKLLAQDLKSLEIS